MYLSLPDHKRADRPTPPPRSATNNKQPTLDRFAPTRILGGRRAPAEPVAFIHSFNNMTGTHQQAAGGRAGDGDSGGGGGGDHRVLSRAKVQQENGPLLGHWDKQIAEDDRREAQGKAVDGDGDGGELIDDDGEPVEDDGDPRLFVLFDGYVDEVKKLGEEHACMHAGKHHSPRKNTCSTWRPRRSQDGEREKETAGDTLL